MLESWIKILINVKFVQLARPGDGLVACKVDESRKNFYIQPPNDISM